MTGRPPRARSTAGSQHQPRLVAKGWRGGGMRSSTREPSLQVRRRPPGPRASRRSRGERARGAAAELRLTSPSGALRDVSTTPTPKAPELLKTHSRLSEQASTAASRDQLGTETAKRLSSTVRITRRAVSKQPLSTTSSPARVHPLVRRAQLPGRTFRQRDVFPSRFLLLSPQVGNDVVQIVVESSGQFVANCPDLFSWRFRHHHCLQEVPRVCRLRAARTLHHGKRSRFAPVARRWRCA